MASPEEQVRINSTLFMAVGRGFAFSLDTQSVTRAFLHWQNGQVSKEPEKQGQDR